MPKVKLVWNRYKNASPTTAALIEVYVSYMCRQKWISTGIRALPKEWSPDGFVTNRQDALETNRFLNQLLFDVRKVVNQMMEEGKVDLFAIPEYLKRLRIKEVDFFEFCEKRIKVRQYGKAVDSRERYDRFLRFLREYGKIKDFNDIKEEKIIELDEYLVSRGMQQKSRWHNYHRFLNSFILDAIEEGLIRKNPYRWLNIARGDDRTGLGKTLTPEEFRKIESLTINGEALSRIRDVFVFQTYTCLSYTDLRSFDATKIQEVDGMKVYVGNRGKTKQTFTIPLQDQALSILQKYNGQLPIISNVKYNEHLKELAAAAGIDKPLSTHWARHTGATMLLNAGVPMQVVSKICGHSSTKMTEQVYAKLLDETVVKAVKEVKLTQK